MSVRAEQYEIRVETHYGEPTALVHEFPSLSWIAPTEADAIAGMRSLLADVLADMEANHEHIPAPGRFATLH
jgi:hypothetical protein